MSTSTQSASKMCKCCKSEKFLALGGIIQFFISSTYWYANAGLQLSPSPLPTYSGTTPDDAIGFRAPGTETNSPVTSSSIVNLVKMTCSISSLTANQTGRRYLSGNSDSRNSLNSLALHFPFNIKSTGEIPSSFFWIKSLTNMHKHFFFEKPPRAFLIKSTIASRHSE
ncbi:hypothetical protein D3C78_1349540 [compost metagenome]